MMVSGESNKFPQRLFHGALLKNGMEIGPADFHEPSGTYTGIYLRTGFAFVFSAAEIESMYPERDDWEPLNFSPGKGFRDSGWTEHETTPKSNLRLGGPQKGDELAMKPKTTVGDVHNRILIIRAAASCATEVKFMSDEARREVLRETQKILGCAEKGKVTSESDMMSPIEDSWYWVREKADDPWQLARYERKAWCPAYSFDTQGRRIHMDTPEIIGPHIACPDAGWGG